MLRLIESNHFQPQQIMHSDSINQVSDEKFPKRVRLPSISSIAQSLPQQKPQVINRLQQTPSSSSSSQQQKSPPPPPPPPLDNLKAAADIFTNSDKLNIPNSVHHATPKVFKNLEINHLTPPSINYYNSSSVQPVVVYPSQAQIQSQPQQNMSIPMTTAPPQFQQYQQATMGLPNNALSLSPPPYFTTNPSNNVYTHYSSPIASLPTPTSATSLIHNDLSKVKKPFTSTSSRRLKDRKSKTPLFCQRCGTTETPEWRKGPNGARTLCNACGLFHAKVLKRDGPVAAANAIVQVANLRKKPNPYQRRSLNDFMMGNNSLNEEQYSNNNFLHHPNQHPHHPHRQVVIHHQQVGTIPSQQTAYIQHSTPIQVHTAIQQSSDGTIQQVPIAIIPTSQIHYPNTPLTLVSPQNQPLMPSNLPIKPENIPQNSPNN